MIGLHATYGTDDSFRLTDICSIGSPRVATPGHVETCLVKLDGGRQVRLMESQIEALMRRPVQLLPAEPGSRHIWGGLDRSAEGGEYWVETTPLIAWALCVDGEVRPVTARGVNDGSGRHYAEFYVEMADGSIQGTGTDYEEPFFDDRDAYRAHILAQARAASEAAAKEQAHDEDA